jgi:hypothetical protein
MVSVEDGGLFNTYGAADSISAVHIEPLLPASAGYGNRRDLNPATRIMRARIRTRNIFEYRKHRSLASHLQGFVTTLSTLQDAL